MKTLLNFLPALALLSVPIEATAGHYDYTYTFNQGATVSGSFSGTADGNLIVDLTNITANVNGIPFEGSGDLLAYSWSNTSYSSTGLGWVQGGAQVSLDGSQNNFWFADGTPYGVGGPQWTNQFFGITGSATAPPIAPPEIGWGDFNIPPINGSLGTADFPPNSSWRVTFVPESPTIWVSALSLLGLAMSRRRARPHAPTNRAMSP